MPATDLRLSLKAPLCLFMLASASLIAPHCFANTQSIQIDNLPTPSLSRFVKIDENRQALDANSPTWECVEDTDTQLFWQKRDPTSALHDTNETYHWYQPQHPNPGTPLSAPNLPGVDATCYGFEINDSASYCNTDAFIHRVNQLNYCGYNDWRLPEANELLSLVGDSNNDSPLPDPDFFPHYDPFAYWTNTVDDQGNVITVILGNKLLTHVERHDRILLRLVRGRMPD